MKKPEKKRGREMQEEKRQEKETMPAADSRFLGLAEGTFNLET